MDTLLLLQQYQLKKLYNSFFFYKEKDKNHMVLEPLQAMIQLSLLSVCNIGTKLTISNNTLFIQHPSLVQPLHRWYNSDKKDDLYFLFPVIKKFIKWYNPLNKNSPLTKELYDIILKMSIKGLNNLVKTYQSANNITVTQVITMYIELLTNNDFNDNNQQSINEITDIDEIFVKIIHIYKPPLLNILYNMLIIIQEEANFDNITNYINGLTYIMKKMNNEAKDWIQNKLILK
jgi:hypothetical protein